jgi:CheY-like chemotaxis protein
LSIFNNGCGGREGALFPHADKIDLERFNTMSKQITVLVVDADPVFRESMANLLLACGVDKFEMAATTKEAVGKISKSSFDVIFVDLFMPHLKGLYLAQEFRKQMPKTKILLLLEDQQLPALDGVGQAQLNFPTVLKSFLSRNLPQLLWDEYNMISQQS